MLVASSSLGAQVGTTLETSGVWRHQARYWMNRCGRGSNAVWQQAAALCLSAFKASRHQASRAVANRPQALEHFACCGPLQALPMTPSCALKAEAFNKREGPYYVSALASLLCSH